MDNYFVLTVKAGSAVNRPNGKRQTLNCVPKNALEIWEEGSATLLLREPGLELLAEYPKERLEKILKLRRNLNFKNEIKLLESAIKAIGKKKTVPADKKD